VPDIRHAITIEASPDHIYPLIAVGTGFTKWWAADVRESDMGRVAELGFFNRATIYRLKLVRAVEPLESDWLCETGKEWEGTRIRFLLTANNKQTLLRFWHAGWLHETDYFTSCNTTWGELMFRLKAAAEGKPAVPLFSATGLAY
jgi:hypothetical protein